MQCISNVSMAYLTCPLHISQWKLHTTHGTLHTLQTRQCNTLQTSHCILEMKRGSSQAWEHKVSGSSAARKYNWRDTAHDGICRCMLVHNGETICRCICSGECPWLWIKKLGHLNSTTLNTLLH